MRTSYPYDEINDQVCLSNLTPLIPNILALMSPIQAHPIEFDDDEFVAASDTLQEIMSNSVLADGAGSRTLTEPLLLWFNRYGGSIVDSTLSSEFVPC